MQRVTDPVGKPMSGGDPQVAPSGAPGPVTAFGRTLMNVRS
jgi:hypothetical protein